jgi:hypothetical protein
MPEIVPVPAWELLLIMAVGWLNGFWCGESHAARRARVIQRRCERLAEEE